MGESDRLSNLPCSIRIDKLRCKASWRRQYVLIQAAPCPLVGGRLGAVKLWVNHLCLLPPGHPCKSSYTENYTQHTQLYLQTENINWQLNRTRKVLLCSVPTYRTNTDTGNYTKHKDQEIATVQSPYIKNKKTYWDLRLAYKKREVVLCSSTHEE